MQWQRNFSWLAILGLNIVLGGTWFTWLTLLPFVFLNGGHASAAWTYVASWALSATTVLSLAEMASIAPVAGKFAFILIVLISLTNKKQEGSITGESPKLFPLRVPKTGEF